MKPIIIENFQQGISGSPKGAFLNMRCLNVIDEPGVAFPGRKNTDVYTAMTDYPIAGAYYDGKHYMVDDSGDIYNNGGTGGAWQKLTLTDASGFSSGKLSVWKGCLCGTLSGSMVFMDTLGNDTEVNNFSTGSGATNTGLFSYAAADGKLYSFRDNLVDRLEEVAGSNFTPANASTFTITKAVLDLPEGTVITCVTEQLGNLIMGTSDGRLYSWNMVDSSFAYPAIGTEKSVNQLITINNYVYAQIGSEGNWYAYDSVRVFKILDFPKTLSNYYTVHTYPDGVMAYDGDIIFGVTCANFSSGIYRLNPQTGVLTCESQIRDGSKDYKIRVLLPYQQMINNRYLVGWEYSGAVPANGVSLKNSNINGGFDTDESSLETGLLTVGYLKGETIISDIEIRFAKPLTALDSVKVYYREDLNAAYTLLDTINTVGTIGKILPKLPKLSSLQLKIVLNEEARLFWLILK